MRKYSRFDGKTVRCHTVGVGPDRSDPWCTYHGKYLLDCLHCGRLFHTDRPHTRFCSNACKQAAYRIRRKGIEYADR